MSECGLDEEEIEQDQSQDDTKGLVSLANYIESDGNSTEYCGSIEGAEEGKEDAGDSESDSAQEDTPLDPEDLLDLVRRTGTLDDEDSLNSDSGSERDIS